jgi:hypothetical protein
LIGVLETPTEKVALVMMFSTRHWQKLKVSWLADFPDVDIRKLKQETAEPPRLLPFAIVFNIDTKSFIQLVWSDPAPKKQDQASRLLQDFTDFS